MYLLYVDESGTPALTGKVNDHFVLLGFAISADTWRDKSEQINSLKRKYFLEGKELHTGWLVRRYVEQEKIADFATLPRPQREQAVKRERNLALRVAAAGSKSSKALANLAKNFNKTNDYIHLTFQERRQLLLELLGLVATWEDCRLFVEAIQKTNYRYPDPPFQEAFTQLVSRFESFLTNFGRYNQANLKGIIIQDDNPTEAKQLTQLMKEFHSKGTPWRNIDKIVETPLFVDSQLTEMIQVADACAYATRRFFEKAETNLFDIIYPRFDRAGATVVGIRHYTGSQPCTCRVCADHRPPSG